MKTFSPKPGDIERRWYVVDADGAVLGRLASEVAKILRGKHKPIFAPHADTGDHVIVINARGATLTGGKRESKIYYRHSGFPGGLREINYDRLLTERPVLAVEKAVRGMLPKNRLGRQVFRKLSVYAGPEHPHAAQRPVPLSLGEVPKWGGLPVPTPKPAGTTRDRSASGRAGKEPTKKATGPKPRSADGGRAKAAGRKSDPEKASGTRGRRGSRSAAPGSAEPEKGGRRRRAKEGES